MSNRKSLKERLNNIKDKGPTKWLTRGLFDVTNPPVVVETYKDQGRDDSVSMGGSIDPPGPSGPPGPRWGSKPSHSDSHPMWDKLNNIVTSDAGKHGQNHVKGRKLAIERFADPEFKKKTVEFFHERDRHSKENQDRFNRFSKVTDEKSGENFIRHILGYDMNSAGNFSIPSAGLNPQEKVYYGAPYTGGTDDAGKKGSSRQYLPTHIVEAFKDDPERLEIMKNAIDESGVKDLHKQMVMNNIPYELAEKLYNRFDSKARTDNSKGWNRWGASGTTELLNARDIEYRFDDNGQFTGTNLDHELATLTTEEEKQRFFNQHFIKDEFTNNRGIALLQKVLATGGRESLSLSPDGLSPLNSTIDHGVAIEKGDKRFAEVIGNLLLSNGSLNQHKVNQNEDLNKVGETVDNAIAGKVKTKDGNLNLQSHEDSEIAMHTQELMNDKHFKESQGGNFAPAFIKDLIDDVVGSEDILNMEWPNFWELMQHEQKAGKRGTKEEQQVKQFAPGSLTRRTADHRDQPWGGDPNIKNGTQLNKDNSLEYLRKAMLINSLFGSEMQDHVSRAFEEFKGARGGVTTDTKQKVGSYLGKVFQSKFKGPMKARVQAWLNGLTDNNSYVESLYGDLGNKALADLPGQVSNYDDIESKLLEERESYQSLIDNYTEGLEYGKGTNGRNKHLSEDDRSKYLTPYKEENGKISMNSNFRKENYGLFRSEHSRKALREQGFGDAIDLYDRAMDEGVEGLTSDKLKTNHSPYSDDDLEFVDLIEQSIFNPKQGTFLEQLVLE